VRTQVPEELEQGRVRSGPWASTPDRGLCGAFVVEGPGGALIVAGHTGEGDMVCIDLASGERRIVPAATGWEHVTVETNHRIPSWDEMCFVKNLFWQEEECVVEYHPPLSQYVKYNPYCLHLWRPKHATIPAPSVSIVARGFEC
jgi:hypothetical protein